MRTAMSWKKLDKTGESWADIWKLRVWDHCEHCLFEKVYVNAVWVYFLVQRLHITPSYERELKPIYYWMWPWHFCVKICNKKLEDIV